MSQVRLADVCHDPFEASRLAACLAKLSGAFTPVSPEPQQQPDNQGVQGDWLNRWAHKQDQITRRLRLIEAELCALNFNNSEPQLSIFSPTH